MGYSAIADHDRLLDVLDLSFDSVLDERAIAPERTLLFARSGSSAEVEVEVHGFRQLTVDVRVRPAGHVCIEARARDRHGHSRISQPAGGSAFSLQSGLTSFLIHWPDHVHRPARTAWVVL